MRSIKIICALIITVAAVSTVLFTSCNNKKDFIPVTVVTTQKQTTEPETFVYRDYEVFGTKMGMSVEEVQKALNVPLEIFTSDRGLYYSVIYKNDLEFVTKGQDALVYIIFSEKGRLCEIQYASTEQTGFDLNNAISSYNKQYGKHIEVESNEAKKNYVWYKDGVYIVITTVTDGQNAMSFFDKDYFEINYPEEALAYNAK